MSVQALSYVFEHSDARLGARLVLLSIANHARGDGTGAWPSVGQLAKESGVSPRQAQRCLRILVENGDLIVDKSAGPHGTNLYSLPGMSPIQGTDISTRHLPTIHRGGDISDQGGDISDQESALNVTRTVIEPSIELEPLGAGAGAESKCGPEALFLVDRLRELIVDNGSRNPAVGAKWYDAARLLLGADGADFDEAVAVLNWCQADPFWRAHVLTMMKFRTRYDQLRLLSRAGGRRGAGRSAADDAAVLASLAEMEKRRET